MVKAERLLNLLVMLLEASKPVSLQDIHRTIPGYGQDEWQSFKRMFERDKEELREMGIPLELGPLDIWETEQGYWVPKDRYYLPPLHFEPDELAALWLAAGLVRMNDPETFRSASLKLEYDAPGPAGEESTAPTLPGLAADLGLAESNLPKAFESVTNRKRVSFVYRSKSGSKNRTVDPYRLIHRRGVWYLTGRDHSSDEVRSFRLDRIEANLQLVDPSVPGHDFDPPQHPPTGAVLDLPPFVQGRAIMQAKVRFEPSAAWWVERSSGWLHLERESDGGATALVDITDTNGFIGWLLGFGEAAEVIGPAELRLNVGKRLQGLCVRS